MSWSRRATGAVVDRVIGVAGRPRVVRAARFVLNRARLDSPNAMASNGEVLLQQSVLASASGGRALCVLDVGANEGEWSRSLIDLAGRAEPSVSVDLHCFEPSAFTADRLRAALPPGSASINRMALSDHEGTATLYVDGQGAGSNSLHARSSSVADTEVVDLTTLDAFCESRGLRHVDLVKIDTEGHDLSVLRGASRMLDGQAIEVVQFEYNHRWIGARAYLRDAFDLLVPLGYTVGKVTPKGIEAYPHGWDPELESFIEGNYVAFTSTAGKWLPLLAWWKEA